MTKESMPFLINDVKVREDGSVDICYADGNKTTLGINDLAASVISQSDYTLNSTIADAAVTDKTISAISSSCANKESDITGTISSTCQNNDVTGIYYPHPQEIHTIGIDTTGGYGIYPDVNGYISSGIWTTSTHTSPKYFLEKEENANWIISMFASYYVEKILKSSTQKKSKKTITIKFFGIENGTTSTFDIAIDVMSVSVKDLLDKATRQARNLNYTELFGPLTNEIDENTYVNAAEEAGLFFKEFYDDKEFDKVLKSHKLPLKQSLRRTSNDSNQHPKSVDKTLKELQEIVDKYAKDKAPYEIIDEEDEDSMDFIKAKVSRDEIEFIKPISSKDTEPERSSLNASPWWEAYCNATSVGFGRPTSVTCTASGYESLAK